jgi:NAD(P)-dependent dehydrogenase (short-subunit alcohol dehydrogenase family)
VSPDAWSQRVVLVTGGGRGLGREHALLMGSLGARVVVNDRGVAPDGSGGDPTPAMQVVEEIRQAGGDAVVNDDDIATFDGAARAVQCALTTFGDLHAVVNNAGILRDRMIVSMTEQDFDDVIAVHLKGTFNVTRHAAAHWREQTKLGRTAPRSIVNTSSSSGLHGNVGQINYGAAKAGIATMTVVSAMELERYGVKVNCIAPIAQSRMTDMTPGLGEKLASEMFDPRKVVAPLVTYLSSPDCRFTGQVFSVHWGSVGLYSGWSIAEEAVGEGPWELDELSRAMEKLSDRVPVRTQADTVARAFAAVT